ncbi:MAG: nickel/cobalt ABC transporter permease [Eubacteriales bacterium]
MKEYVVKRLLFLIPMFFLVSFIAFMVVNASTDTPAEIILEAQGVPLITEELIEKTNEEYGFDKPLLERYKNWLKDAVRLEFGKSFVNRQDVSKLILRAFGYTLKLALVLIVTTVIVSMLLGVLCAIFEGSFFDKLVRGIMFTVSNVPAYLVGIVCMWFFAVKLGILPTSGVGNYKNFIMPVMALAMGYCGFYFRLIRNSMIENMNENYVYFLRASGVRESKIVKHILKNSLQTAVAAFSLAIPGMIAGTVVIENVFAWPGLGRLCVSSIFCRDIPIIQAYILLIALFYCVFNIIADIVNAFMNPKLRRN